MPHSDLEAKLGCTRLSRNKTQTRPHKAPSNTGTSEMAQRGRALAAKPVGLFSIPGSTQWKERPDSHKLSSDLDMHIIACMCSPQMNNVKQNKLQQNCPITQNKAKGNKNLQVCFFLSCVFSFSGACVCMCVCVCEYVGFWCVYVLACVCVCLWMCVCVYAYVYEFMDVFICICACECVCLWIHVCIYVHV